MYSLETINQFLYLIREGKEQIKEIINFLGISYTTSRKWRIKYKNNIEHDIGVQELKFNTPMIHGRNKKYYYYDLVEEYVEKNNGCSLYDIHNSLDKELSLSTISRICKEKKITYKTIKNRITLKSEEELEKKRKEFSNLMDTVKFNNFISIDEVHFTNRDCKRKGYSKVSVPIKKVLKHKKSKETRSVIFSINNNSIISYQIFNESINSNRYLEYLKNNLEYFKDQTLIQDNCRIHHSNIVKDYSENNNIYNLYIPPYSPELNPIELVFSELKRIFRNNDYLTNLEERIEYSIKLLNISNFQKYFNKTITVIKSYKDCV